MKAIVSQAKEGKRPWMDGFLPHLSGAVPLDAAAFGTRIFRHQPRYEAPAAFVAAPAFIWRGLLSGRAGEMSTACTYTVLGVYSVDARTLETWRAHGLIRDRVRVFSLPGDAVSYAERCNHETARQYFEDLRKGFTAHVTTWKAFAVDAFRLLSTLEGKQGTLAS